MSDAHAVLERRSDLSDVKAVVFDLDGTLYEQAPLRRAMALRLVRSHAAHPVHAGRTVRILRAYRRAQEQLRGNVAGIDLAAAQIAIAAERTGVSRDEVARCVERWMDVGPLD